jgi:hypothetical protein
MWGLRRECVAEPMAACAGTVVPGPLAPVRRPVQQPRPCVGVGVDVYAAVGTHCVPVGLAHEALRHDLLGADGHVVVLRLWREGEDNNSDTAL